jgi:hypothetical protein
MNKFIMPEDVVKVIKSFLAYNEGDEATECLILSIGAEILNVSEETLMEIIN